MKSSLEMKGFGGLKDGLLELEQFTGRTNTGKNAVKRGMIKAMKRIEDHAKALAPKDTGKLAKSITTKPVKAKRISRRRYARTDGIAVQTGPKGKRIEGGNAAWQEYGTVTMPARPYMRPAADAEGQAVVDDLAGILQEEIGKSVERARRKAARGK